jgi:ATP-binding cassette subfamily F protein 3
LQDAGANDAAARAQALILGLGFAVRELSLPVNSFSGGWRMRLQLARALMCPADLLLLDEPTNHLDFDALIWLEGWLRRFSGTLLVISHDRTFLDSTTQTTLHMDAGQLTRYSGNYSQFEELRAARLALQQNALAKQQEQVAHLQKFIARFKAKASKAKQAQSRVKALERMEKITPLLSEAEFQFAFQAPAQLPNPMLTLHAVCVGYAATAGQAPVVQNVSRSVLAGQRIGILGANGQGKSTLVKTIARVLPALRGKLTEGRGLNVGYFAQQELDVLRLDETPLEHMLRWAKDLAASGKLGNQPTREQDLRNFLGRFHFGGDLLQQPVGSMSGGEKARLVLCMIVWQRPNLLLLDEPTNHLDLVTREALAMALNEFEGSVLLVSHDRALLRSVCDEFWLVAQGALTPFDGDLDDYQRYVLDAAKRQRMANKSANAPKHKAPPAATDKPKPQRQAALQQSLHTLEAQMATLHQKAQALETQLQTSTAQAELAELGSSLQSVQAELQALEEKWLHLSEQLEASDATARLLDT